MVVISGMLDFKNAEIIEILHKHQTSPESYLPGRTAEIYSEYRAKGRISGLKGPRPIKWQSTTLK